MAYSGLAGVVLAFVETKGSVEIPGRFFRIGPCLRGRREWQPAFTAAPIDGNAFAVSDVLHCSTRCNHHFHPNAFRSLML